MSPRDPRERGRAALLAAVERDGQERARAAERGPEPWPGDLYVLDETADWPVEWLVVERSRGRCRMVAADTHPALGAADVSVLAESASGPLSVRCAVSARIGVATLRRGERVGAVGPDVLDAVRRRLEELAAGSSDPRLGAGGEPDPELEDWVDEVLEPARAALLSASLDAPGSPRRFGVRIAGAVFLILLLAVGGVSMLAWRFYRDGQEARREVERLSHERRERGLINLAYVTFYPGLSRGNEVLREIEVPRQATHLFLLFSVGHPEGCTTYELSVANRGVPTSSFTLQGLRLLPEGEVSVAVSRAQLKDGAYQLRIAGLCKGQRRVLAEYGARLKWGGK